MPTIKELKQHINNHHKDDEVVHCIIWGVEDVMGQAENMGRDITKEQAEEVLENLESNHDCNLGTTWETIGFWIGEI